MRGSLGEGRRPEGPKPAGVRRADARADHEQGLTGGGHWLERKEKRFPVWDTCWLAAHRTKQEIRGDRQMWEGRVLGTILDKRAVL